MIFEVKNSAIYLCSLERAFRTPMLCDLSKIHTGYGLMPMVTQTTDDNNWGQPGSSKKVHVRKSLTQNGGYGFTDRVLERHENNYWTIQVDEFQFWMIGFSKFVGKWKVIKLASNKVQIEYSYWLHADKPFFYPINWVFANLFWKMYMKRVLDNIRVLAINNEPYLYN